MRIDLPGCSFKNCKYCSDCNCTNQNKYETCDYRVLKDEFVSGQLALQKEIEKLDALLVCKNKVIHGLEKSFENAYDGAIKEFAELVDKDIEEKLSDSIKEQNPHLYLIHKIVKDRLKEMVGEE